MKRNNTLQIFIRMAWVGFSEGFPGENHCHPDRRSVKTNQAKADQRWTRLIFSEERDTC